jgi:endo-1,4-beta-mannosidase
VEERNVEPQEQPFVLGVNYWPRRKAMYWWSDFDAGEVREEFEIIRSLGLGLVRIFLLWEDWQPNPETVAPAALDHFEMVCDIAASLGLTLDVTFFTGHMSGPSWVPGWMLRRDEPRPPRVRQVVNGGQAIDCGYANQFTDPVTLKAEELLLRTVVSRFRDHPAVSLWNLGNEPDLFAWPPDAAAGRGWVRHLASLIRGVDPDHSITCGLHAKNLVEDNGLRVSDVFAEVDVAVMHGYPMYVDWADDPLDPDLVPFFCALTSALCGKPTLMEEFGGCTEAPGRPSSVWRWTAYGQPRRLFMASEEALAGYLQEVLPRLVEVGATGAVLWCYADYAPELWNRPPCDESRHERFFGLVRPDGTLKPHTEVVRRFAATNPRIQPAQRRVSLDVSPDAYYQDPLTHAKRLYHVFLERGC